MRNYPDDAASAIFVFRSGVQQVVAGALALAMLPLSLGMALGQEAGPPPLPEYGQEGAPQSSYLPQGPDQLDQLVAPIALYPDSLVAQVLAGATYPAQLESAEQFVQQSGNYPPEQLAEQANTEPWDPSVKALVAFPQVLADLNRNLQWTVQLGNAYYNQPQDVLNAVQVMRQRAYAAGNLRTTQQLNVIYQPDDIVIAPVSPVIVYVPYYNPWLVYGEPIDVYPHYYYGPPRGIAFGTGLALGFGAGIAVGAFTHFGWGYHSWQPDWRSHAVLYQHNTYISNSVTVINHGNYGHYDRAPEARAFNQQQSARYNNVSNRTTINNVPVNRGGNTFNNGGNTFNRSGNAVNRGPQTFGNGANTYNRSGGAVNNGSNTISRGSQPFNNGGNTSNRVAYSGTQNAGRLQAPQQQTPQQYNRPVQQQAPQQYNRPVQQQAPQQYNRPVQQQAPQQQYNRPVPQQAPQQQYNRPVQQQAPQQQYNRPMQQQAQQQYNRPVQQQAPQQQYSRPVPQQAPPQQYNRPVQQQAPQQQHSEGSGGHENHGGGGAPQEHHR